MNEKTIKLSPNSLNLYLECKRCFWLDKRKGIKRPQPFPYSLNLAVDKLLKEEFDEYRAKKQIHPLIIERNIPAKLFSNQELLNQWRSNFVGIRYYDEKIGATLFGAVDDILEFEGGRLAPLDYKSTGATIPSVYDRFQLQMDVYTFLLEKNGFLTPRKGYLAFYIVDKDNGFRDRLPFQKELHEIETDPSYVYELFKEAVDVLKNPVAPPHSPECEFGRWLDESSKI